MAEKLSLIPSATTPRPGPMTEPATRTRRLLLEGFVIVASILLAFAIDAGWDERQERAAERRLLTSLEAEFAQHIEDLHESSGTHARLASLTRALFDTLSSRAEGEEVVVSDSLAYATMRARTTEISQGELDAALASGRVDLVGDPELRRRLAGWPGVWDDAEEEEVWTVEFFLGRLGAELGRSADVSTALMEGLLAGRTAEGPGSAQPRRIRNTAALRAALAMRFTLELGAFYGMENALLEARVIRGQLRERLGLPPVPDPTDGPPVQDPLEN